MTHAHHVTPARTAARIQNIRSLITILIERRQVLRDELGGILKVGPSGVRKHLKDLRGKVELTIIAGSIVCRLAMSDEEARAYLVELATPVSAPVPRPRPSRSEFGRAAQDPRRHFHILADDTHYAVRVNRAPIVRDPLIEAFFGPAVPPGLLMQSPPCSTRMGAV